jgi:phosphatidylserine/phosphatidylglycerophosphate/cardiolipin synthase-like enzyme
MFMIKKQLLVSLLLGGFLLLALVTPLSASERMCDASFENCKAPLLTLIQNEKVEIDVAFWFMDDLSIQNALTKKIQSGVKVRMLVDPRADEGHPTNTAILQAFAGMTPPVPMRKRVADGILHWKMMLFAGQGVVEFSGANFSNSEMVPSKVYQSYVDEAIFYSDDAAIVNSFRTMYDNWWINSGFADYANTSGTQLTRSYAIYPIETEACSSVPGGCGMDFLPSSNWQNNYGTKTQSAIKAEKVKLDIDMFRITNPDITDATIAAFNRGLPIRVLVDASEYTNTARPWDRYNVDRLFMAGIPIKITKHAGQNHEKSLLLYGQGLAIWGSSNWTTPSFNIQQEHNYFNLTKPWFFQWFVNHFERRWNSPQEYKAFVPIGPSSPVNKGPANGATGQTQTVTLTWDPGFWGQMFDIYVGTKSPPTLIASNVVTGSVSPPPDHRFGTFQISGLAPNTTYYWKIVSKTMTYLTANGPVWSFTTGGTTATSGATVTSVSPASGSSTGGTLVTITGTNFAAGATVSFGLASATNVTVVNSTTITATTPPYVAGAANVAVMNQAGDSGSLQSGFTYTSTSPLPKLNVVVPNTGSPAGGDTVTITGSNLVRGMTVTFGGAPATIISSNTVSIQATTPPGSSGPVDVTVTNPNGPTVSLKAAFTYADTPPPPTVTAISPASGSMNGGAQVVVSGSGFRYGAVVSFGGPPPPIGTGTRATTIAVTNSTTLCGTGVTLPCIIATTPAHSVGPADVVVSNMNPATGIIDSNSGISTLTGGYTFVTAPSINNVTPSSGTVSGGTQITISGANFVSGANVLVGGQQAVVQTITNSSITAITPANSSGTAAVAVVNPDGQSSNTLIFTYQ